MLFFEFSVQHQVQSDEVAASAAEIADRRGVVRGFYDRAYVGQVEEVFDTYVQAQERGQLLRDGDVPMDQIYLALRLAAAKLVQNGRRDTMPLIFDDSFVLYDDERLKTALKWLVKAYDNQIIVFTCHQREAQLLTANQVKYHLVRI